MNSNNLQIMFAMILAFLQLIFGKQFMPLFFSLGGTLLFNFLLMLYMQPRVFNFFSERGYGVQGRSALFNDRIIIAVLGATLLCDVIVYAILISLFL